MIQMRLAAQGSIVQQKTIELFESRRLWDWLLIRGASPYATASIYPYLLAVQESIYKLDQYGETHWAIESSKIDGIWGDILASISAGDAKSVVQPHVVRSLEELKAYQNIELALRYDVDPLALPIANFYYLKSCDLRLCRTLAAERLGLLAPPAAELRLWRLHDVSGEIKDDLNDIEEDNSTFNCNRFMISLVKNGIVYTRREYCKFLRRCSLSLEEILKSAERADESTMITSKVTRESIVEAERALQMRMIEMNDDSVFSPLGGRSLQKRMFGATCAKPFMFKNIYSYRNINFEQEKRRAG